MSSSELEHRNLAVSIEASVVAQCLVESSPPADCRRRSVENLVISSQDAIGQSISQALSFSGVISSQQQHQPHHSDNRSSVSRSPSPCRLALEPTIPESPDDDKCDVPSLAAAVAGQAGDSVSLYSALEAAARGGAGAGPRAKKKSWYSALYPTYKSRSDDFKRLFRDLPDDERLIVDYSCALQKDILAQGRLYVSQNYLCFYANIFGWETSLCLRWNDVTAITKEKTALVIPNAILVCTKSEKHFLASFSGRDKAYLMLFRIWQNALMDQQLSSQEMWQWVRSCYGEELGFNSEEEEGGREGGGEDKLGCARLAPDSISEWSGQGSGSRVSRVSEESSVGASRMVRLSLLSLKEKKEKRQAPEGNNNDCDYLDSSSMDAGCGVGGGGAACEGGGDDAVSSTSLPAAGAAEHVVFARSNSQPPPITLTPPVNGARGGGAAGGGGGAGQAAEADEEEDGDALPTDVSDSSDSDRDKPQGLGGGGAAGGGCAGGGARCVASHEGRSLLQTEVAVNVDQLFTMLFTNSKFCLQLLALRNTGDYIQSTWKHDAESGLKCRQVSYTLALTQPIGPKSVHVTETQVMNKSSRPGQAYSIDISSENVGVPYADSFYVVIHYCLQRRGDCSTALALYCSIKYKKSVWGIVKGFIEKNTWAGLEDYVRQLEAALAQETDGERALTKRKGKRRRRLNSSSQETAAGAAGGGGGGGGGGACAVLAAPRAPASRAPPAPPAARAGTRWLLGILTLLLLLNMLLYWKLYYSHSAAAAFPYIDRDHFHHQAGEVSAERAAEWARLLERATHERRDALHSWRDALHQAIHTLRQTEQALGKLLDTIRPSLEQAQAEGVDPTPAASVAHDDL